MQLEPEKEGRKSVLLLLGEFRRHLESPFKKLSRL